MLLFSEPGPHVGHHVMFNDHVSLGSSGLRWFLRLSLFLVTFTVLKSIGQIFIECPSIRICLLFSHHMTGALGLGQERPERQRAIFITSYQGYVLSI